MLQSPIPVRCADDFNDAHTIPAVDGLVGEEYIDLDKALSDLSLYKAVCLNDFCPDDRHRWKVYIAVLLQSTSPHQGVSVCIW